MDVPGGFKGFQGRSSSFQRVSGAFQGFSGVQGFQECTKGAQSIPGNSRSVLGVLRTFVRVKCKGFRRSSRGLSGRSGRFQFMDVLGVGFQGPILNPTKIPLEPF